MVTNSIFRLRKSFAASSAAFRVAVVIFVGPAGLWDWHCTMNIRFSLPSPDWHQGQIPGPRLFNFAQRDGTSRARGADRQSCTVQPGQLSGVGGMLLYALCRLSQFFSKCEQF